VRSREISLDGVIDAAVSERGPARLKSGVSFMCGWREDKQSPLLINFEDPEALRDI